MATTNPATNRTNGAGKHIAASSVGTLLEWYDIYVFTGLAPILSARFFPRTSQATSLLCTLAVFGAGLLMRPLGALVFGRIGDRTGRKPAFLITLTVMGLSTFAVGLVPGYDSIGMVAPLIVLLLRLLQGLAAGGEFGVAATYAAEYAPANRRGYLSSWVQASAVLGLVLSLVVILVTRYALDPDRDLSLEKFDAWGWRIPFVLSILLVAVSAYFRSKLEEPPPFDALKTNQALSPNPLKESLAPTANLKVILLSIAGLTMGQGVVFYTCALYAQSFLQKVCMIDIDQARRMLLVALALAVPFYILSGRWSDRLHRKWIMLAGMLLAIGAASFLFRDMRSASSTAGRKSIPDRTEIRNTISFIGKTKTMLQSAATITYFADGMQEVVTKSDTVYADGHHSARSVTTVSRTLPVGDFWTIVVILFVIGLFTAISLGPVPAFLADLFPTRVRCTSLSLACQAGGGLFGGLTPLIAIVLNRAYPGDPLAGLWYPIGVTIVCLVIGALLLPGGRKTGHLQIAP